MQAGREIKFQVWDQDAKKMWTWEDINKADQEGILCFLDMLEEDQFIPRQFTGLHDKNGKEIYEGDIVRVRPRLVENQDAFTALVVWKRSGFELDRTIDGWIGYPIVTRLDGMAEEFEVIGNIYENPNLLQSA